MSDDALVHLLLSVVAALLTVLYAIAGWNWIKLNSEVKELRMALIDKADEKAVDQRHTENKGEFKNLEDMFISLRTFIEGNERRAADTRERMQRDIQTLAADVAGIKGYIAGLTEVTRDAIIDMILRLEGGYVDSAADPGGATNFGITQRYLNNARSTWPTLPASVQDLTQSQAAALYQNDEWVAIKGDQLPAAVAPLVMDEAVNAGPAAAVKLLQESLAVLADKVLGPTTLAAANAADPLKLAAEYAARRATFYANLDSTEAQFELGWARRLITVYTLSISP